MQLQNPLAGSQIVFESLRPERKGDEWLSKHCSITMIQSKSIYPSPLVRRSKVIYHIPRRPTYKFQFRSLFRLSPLIPLFSTFTMGKICLGSTFDPIQLLSP